MGAVPLAPHATPKVKRSRWAALARRSKTDGGAPAPDQLTATKMRARGACVLTSARAASPLHRRALRVSTAVTNSNNRYSRKPMLYSFGVRGAGKEFDTLCTIFPQGDDPLRKTKKLDPSVRVMRLAVLVCLTWSCVACLVPCASTCEKPNKHARLHWRPRDRIKKRNSRRALLHAEPLESPEPHHYCPSILVLPSTVVVH